LLKNRHANVLTFDSMMWPLQSADRWVGDRRATQPGAQSVDLATWRAKRAPT